jgi:hypothetical protein
MKTGTVAFGYLARALALNSGSVRGTFGYPRHAPLLTAGDGLRLTTPILEKCSKVNSRELSDLDKSTDPSERQNRSATRAVNAVIAESFPITGAAAITRKRM